MNKIALLALMFGATTWFWSCSPNRIEEGGLILDIPILINKTPTEVVEILGEPDTSYYEQVLAKSFLVHRYKKHDIEVQYLKGKSNDIIINEPLPVKFDPESLKHFGLKPIEPTVSREKGMLKWKNYSGLKTINFYKVRVDSAGNIIGYKIFFKA